VWAEKEGVEVVERSRKTEGRRGCMRGKGLNSNESHWQPSGALSHTSPYLEILNTFFA